MTLYDFIALDEMEQQMTIWDAGDPIGKREDEEHNIFLYQIDSFYVEVFKHKEYGVVRKYRPFTSTEQLKPYLDQLNIDEVL